MSFPKIKEAVLNLLFPIECLGCGRDDFWLCEDCEKKLNYNQNYFIEKSAFSYLDGAFIVFDYNNKLIEKLIKNFKYKFIKDIGDILGLLAFSFLKNKQDRLNLKNILIIPVPLHKKRENWRGFNQAEIIASVIARSLSDVLVPTVALAKGQAISSLDTYSLIKTKNTQLQAKLDKEKREINIQGSFFWKGKNLKNKTILLIDDVMTTGSTLEECARVLKDARALKVYALVIARG